MEPMGFMARVRFQARARDFSLLQRVKCSSEAHPVFYVKGTGALEA
jgi:hypothetical protein